MPDVTVLVIPDSEPAFTTRIEAGDLSAYQGFVGGYIEPLTVNDTVFLFNEDGYGVLPVNTNARFLVEALAGQRSNQDFYGTAVVVSEVDEDGTFTSVSEKVLTLYTQSVSKPEQR